MIFLDLSAFLRLVFDSSFSALFEKNNQSNFAEINGYENLIGGQGNDTLIGFG